MFTSGDDSFLRGRSLADAMKSLAAQQVLIGRLDPSKSAQVAAILLNASGSINAKTGDDRANAINAVVVSLFRAQLLQTAKTDNGDSNKAEGEVAFALTDALQTQGATQVASTLDVGCSQSILSWEEARDIFGTRVANTYLVVQVIVRNLNSSEEFMMHDVQIALDATTLPINVTFGQSGLNQTRFVAGRDKMLARGVAVVGQQMDHRNFFIRVAEALGDVTLAAATAAGRAHFIDGVSIYKSVLIPGLKSVYPDLTIDQLNRLNDLAFSSSSAYKIVVPKNGSVPFVTFLPAKIFAAAPTVSSNPPSSAPAANGGNAWQYKKWTQEQMLLLQESMYVVFAGAHVVEDTGNAITKLDCPSTGGYLDLSKGTQDANKNNVLSCTVTGTGLKAGMSLSLRTGDSTITQTIDSPLNVTNDTTGTAAFKIPDLDAAQVPQYTLYLVTTSGAQATSLTVKLQPVISDANAMGCGSDCSFTIKGTNLGLIRNIGLRTKGQTTLDTYTTETAPAPSDGSLTVRVPKPVAAATYNMWIYVAQAAAVDSGKTLTVK